MNVGVYVGWLYVYMSVCECVFIYVLESTEKHGLILFLIPVAFV